MSTTRGGRTVLASLKAKELSLSAQHAALERRLAKISQDLAAAQRKGAVLHNERSPISRLPDGILSNIFNFLHSTQLLEVEGRYWQIDRMPVRAEVNISHVCHRWRVTSLQTPALWGAFWCDKSSHCANIVAASRQLKEYLVRSAPDQDLELYFDFSETNLQPESAATRDRYRVLASELLALTVPHIRRWKNMTIIANDSTRRVSLSSFQRAISCLSAPRLERLTVCVGTSYYSHDKYIVERDGWEDQVLLRRGENDETPCPRLRYLKLDGGGLRYCRPPIQTLTHLLLESEPSSAPPDDDRAQAYKLHIDWSIILSSDILRLPHLESLSLHESILNPHTFPYDGKDIQRLKNDTLKDLFIEALLLKHLRIGGSFRGRYRSDFHTGNGNFLLFLLRFIAAPALESLTVCGYLIDSNPWSDSWASLEEKKGWDGEAFPIYAVQDRFESLKTVVLSDVFVGPSAQRRAPFAHLMRRTSTAQSITISQRWPDDGPVDFSVEFVQDIVFERPTWIRTFWPRATDISINLPAMSEYPERAHEGVLEYVRWCYHIANNWNDVEVVRIPALWLDAWRARLDRPAQMCKEILGGDYYVWEAWIEGDDLAGCDSDGGRYQGNCYERNHAEVGVGEEEQALPYQRYTPSPGQSSGNGRRGQKSGGRPVRVEPMDEVVSRFWPPGGGGTWFNTLRSEQFNPFDVDIS